MDLVWREKAEVEGIAPPLKCLIEVHAAIQNGESIRTGLERYARRGRVGFEADVRRFLFDWDQGRDWRSSLHQVRSSHRRALLEMVACGLAGQAIHAQLSELRKDIEEACDAEVRAHLDMLPLRMLFPLLFMLFPSYLILLFGPLVRTFLQEVAR